MANQWIERYVHAVTHRLPESQRADIDKELQSLIADMLDDRLQGRAATDQDIEAVLLELGDPNRLADRYRGKARFLIGPELYPTYITVLKLALVGVSIAMTVVFIVQSVITPARVLENLGTALSNLFFGAFQAFTWVTLSVGIGEYFNNYQSKDVEKTPAWKPADLPALPEAVSRLRLADPIATIVFTVIVTVLVTFAIDLCGIWVFHEGQEGGVVRFFDAAVFNSYLPYIWAVMALAVLNEIAKLVAGRWTGRLIALDVLNDVAHFALAVAIFSNPAVWNPEFMQQAAQAGLVPASGEDFNRLQTLWQQVTALFLYLIGLVFAIELITSAVRAVRLGRSGARV